jgi:hypothetical protein
VYIFLTALCLRHSSTHIPLVTVNINAYVQETGLRDTSLWKPRISQLLLFGFNAIKEWIVCVYIRSAKEQAYLGIHFILVHHLPI